MTSPNCIQVITYSRETKEQVKNGLWGPISKAQTELAKAVTASIYKIPRSTAAGSDPPCNTEVGSGQDEYNFLPVNTF